MSITLTHTGNTLPLHILEAKSFFARFIGLLGLDMRKSKKALLIPKCSQIHTMGMSSSIDVVWLNQEGRILHIQEEVIPNRLTRNIHSAVSVIELPPGSIKKYHITPGEYLSVKTDAEMHPDFRNLRNLLHWPINIFISLLWSRLVFVSFAQWSADSHPMYLCILIHNTLLMIYFLTRRKSVDVSMRLIDWIVPVVTLCFAMLLRPAYYTGDSVHFILGLIQFIGIFGIIASLISLGRSFGVVPAKRKIITKGAYRIVRHPLYLSELIFYTAFVLGNVSAKNIILIIFILTGQLWRSLSEENILSKDLCYKIYKQIVRYRFIPGLF